MSTNKIYLFQIQMFVSASLTPFIDSEVIVTSKILRVFVFFVINKCIKMLLMAKV